MKVAKSKAAFLLAFACYFIHLSQGSSVYDRFCVRNLGCDTDFQDMILGVPSARLCQLWCDQNEECQYFTWWSEGMFQNICMHHKECTKLDFECVNCHAGPRSSGCPRRNHPWNNWN